MNRTFWVVIIVLIVLIAGAGAYWLCTRQSAPIGIANPASVNCGTLGGTLEITDTPAGQTGYCHLPDGRACEEWGLYRDNVCTPPITTSSESATQQ